MDPSKIQTPGSLQDYDTLLALPACIFSTRVDRHRAVQSTGHAPGETSGLELTPRRWGRLGQIRQSGDITGKRRPDPLSEGLGGGSEPGGVSELLRVSDFPKMATASCQPCFS